MSAAATARLHAMTDGGLADEHRGQTFALERAKAALAAIEAELERRGVTETRGAMARIERRHNDGLLDLPRLRAEMGEAFCRRFAKAGSAAFWRSSTLPAAERGAARD